jgi:short-subunit dehydrogenase
MKLEGRVALVTGASRGIGREIALALGRAGCSVALVARDREALEGVAAELGTERSHPISADLSDTAAARRAFDDAVARFGRIDILVNNAGTLANVDFLRTDIDSLAGTVDVNLRAAVVLARLAAENMAMRRRGHIVNVASLAGVTGVPGEATYAATKAALRVFTASLRPELAPHGIRLTDVVLGFIETDMLNRVESNPRVYRLFNRARRLHLMVDLPPAAVAAAVVEAIEHGREVIVLPERARWMLLPLPGLTRTITLRLLAR